MSNPIETSSEKLARELTVAIDASVGVIAIRCAETEVYRVIDEIYALAVATESQFRIHSKLDGWMRWAAPMLPPDPSQPFNPLEPVASHRPSSGVLESFQILIDNEEYREGYFVMLDLHFTFQEPVTQMLLRRQLQRALTVNQRLFIIVPASHEIPEAVSPLLHIVDFESPSDQELSEIVQLMLKKVESRSVTEGITEDDIAAIVSNGRGMTATSFETAIGLSITDYGMEHETLEGFGTSQILRWLRDYKTQMLRKTNVLELQTSVDIDAIGGLELFKQWMYQRKATYGALAKQHGVMPSKGALVVGPPGTGKSLVAKAAGSILNLPVLRFDIGKVFGAYIGQSETQMRMALALIDAMSPCVLMLDEIDKGFAGLSGGGGSDGSATQSRVFGTFLTWMQERNQRQRPVFLIMTANRIEGLPPELVRKGRIDETWSVNVPNAKERDAIFRIHLEARGQELNKADLQSIVALTENLVGAEIESICEEARVLALTDDRTEVTLNDMRAAYATLRPMHVTRAAEFQHMREWAANNARDASDNSTVSPFEKNRFVAGPVSGTRRRIIHTKKPKQ